MADRKSSLNIPAQVIRRATLLSDQSLVTKHDGSSHGEIIDDLLSVGLDTRKSAGNTTEWDRITAPAWAGNAPLSPTNPLQDRMHFCWHTLLPCSTKMLTSKMIADHNDAIRSNALTNYKEVLIAHSKSAANIIYLTLDLSVKEENYNENFSRELMELFTLGEINGYTQDDVTAGGLAMTGWFANGGAGVHSGEFRAERSYSGNVTFMGENKKWDMDSIINKLLSMEQTAKFMSSRIGFHLTGVEFTDAKAEEIGKFWYGTDYDIKALIKKLFTDPDLQKPYYSRARTGLEYYYAVHKAAKLSDAYVPEKGDPTLLGQAWWHPPSVGGWPPEQWATPGSFLWRGNFLKKIDFPSLGLDEILDRCGLYQLTDSTYDKLKSIPADDSKLLWMVAMSSMEFNSI